MGASKLTVWFSFLPRVTWFQHCCANDHDRFTPLERQAFLGSQWRSLRDGLVMAPYSLEGAPVQLGTDNGVCRTFPDADSVGNRILDAVRYARHSLLLDGVEEMIDTFFSNVTGLKYR